MFKNFDMVYYCLGMVADLNNRSARFQLIAMLVEGEDERFFAPWVPEEAKGIINGNSFADLLESRKWLRGAGSKMRRSRPRGMYRKAGAAVVMTV